MHIFPRGASESDFVWKGVCFHKISTGKDQSSAKILIMFTDK